MNSFSIQLSTRTLVVLVLMASMLSSAQILAQEVSLQPFFGLRHEPDFDQGEYLDAWFLEDDRSGRDAFQGVSATRMILGLEIYPPNARARDTAPFLSTGLLFGETDSRSRYSDPGGDFQMYSSAEMEELGIFLGAGLRVQSFKFALTFYYLDLDIRDTDLYLRTIGNTSEDGWRSSVESSTVGRYQVAPSVSFSLLRLVDFKLEAWYEAIRSHADASGAYGNGGGVEPGNWRYPRRAKERG
jgi:hypothetical protein